MKANSVLLNAQEKKAALSLSTIYGLRMLGLFMILPVFSLYATELSGSTPLLIGLAMGAYGLTQALFQIPFGMLSDRYGRKPLIIAGMLIFALGSVVAAISESIYGVILGRLLQGSGAVAAVLMATAADLTREENRMKVMASIGMSIGFSFALALVLGSILESWVGVSGIFFLTAILAVFGVLIVIYVLPDITHSKRHRDAQTVVENLSSILKNKQLLRLDLGIFILHTIITSIFLVVPMVMVNQQYINIALAEHWKVYLPVMLLSVVFMVPFIILAESKRKMKAVFVGAIFTMILAVLGFWFTYRHTFGFITSLVFFLAIFYSPKFMLVISDI